MTDAWKPCPACGESALATHWFQKQIQITCSECGCSGPWELEGTTKDFKWDALPRSESAEPRTGTKKKQTMTEAVMVQNEIDRQISYIELVDAMAMVLSYCGDIFKKKFKGHPRSEESFGTIHTAANRYLFPERRPGKHTHPHDPNAAGC